jgi:hypothetical protein
VVVITGIVSSCLAVSTVSGRSCGFTVGVVAGGLGGVAGGGLS